MRNTICSLLVVCGVAVMALSPAAVACDKNKTVASKCGGAQPVAVKVAEGKSECSGRTAVALGAVSDEAGPSCSTKKAMALMVKALRSMEADSPAGTDLRAAMRELARANPQLIDDELLTALRSTSVRTARTVETAAPATSTCGSAQRTRVAAAGSTCSGEKAQGTTYAVTSVRSSCSKSGQARTATVAGTKACDPAACTGQKTVASTVAVSDGSGCCKAGRKTAASTVAVSDGSGCCKAGRKTVASTVAVSDGSGCCKAGQAVKTQAVAAGACDPAACSKAKTVAAGNAACDPAACAKAKAAVAGAKACDPAACQGAKAVAVSDGCSKAAKARFVAFGCEKTDRIARAAARAYLDLIKELKLANNADGCAMFTAKQVLASVLEDMQQQDTATASADDAEVIVVQSQDVAFGAVSDEPKSSCSKN